MNEASKGQTYSEVSGQYIQQCTSDPKAAATDTCQSLGGLRQTLFMGDTLRGLLLYGFAFATIGTIAGYAAIAAFGRGSDPAPAGRARLLALAPCQPHRGRCEAARGRAGLTPRSTTKAGARAPVFCISRTQQLRTS